MAARHWSRGEEEAQLVDPRVAKLAARRQVRDATFTGRLPRLPREYRACVDCGARALIWDHRDYSRPLDVQPVCRQCNIARGPGAYGADIIRGG